MNLMFEKIVTTVPLSQGDILDGCLIFFDARLQIKPYPPQTWEIRKTWKIHSSSAFAKVCEVSPAIDSTSELDKKLCAAFVSGRNWSANESNN